MTVKTILRNELYIGHTIALKKKSRSYRDGCQVDRDPSEWIRTENTHMPIIEENLWQAVQKSMWKLKTALPIAVNSRRAFSLKSLSALIATSICVMALIYATTKAERQ